MVATHKSGECKKWLDPFAEHVQLVRIASRLLILQEMH
jgi:hypothetical protein